MAATGNSEILIDRIYEAAAVPTLWPLVLDTLGDVVGNNGGALWTVRDGYGASVCSSRHDETMSLFNSEGWVDQDQTLKRAYALDHAGFVSDADLFTDDELIADPVYRDFYNKRGWGYRAGTIIPMPVGDSVAFVFPRHHKDGHVPRDAVNFFDGLRPHLARAALTASRIGFERARAQTEAMEMMGLPAAVLRGEGRLLVANSLFEALTPSLFQDRRQRLMLTDLTADALFADALASISRPAGDIVKSVPVGAAMGRVPMILHLVPIRGVAHDIFAQASALLIVTPVDRASVPSANVLQGLFDLTPAEARIARGVGEAQSLDVLASSIGVSRETVRSQLKAVLFKTGLSRQQELVNLLAGKVLPVISATDTE